MTLNGSLIAADVAGKRTLATKSYINIGRIQICTPGNGDSRRGAQDLSKQLLTSMHIIKKYRLFQNFGENLY
jgi:hypothetical protein